MIAADGSKSEKIVDGFFRGDWVEQPDGSGTWIVTSNGTDAIRLIDVEERRVVWEERVNGSASALPMFSPDRRSISVRFQQDRGHDAVAVIDVGTRQRRLAARFPFHTIFRAAWVDGGTAVIVNRVDSQSNVVLFDHFWEPLN